MKNFINNQRLAQLAGVDYDSERIIEGPIVYSRTHTVVSQFPKLAKFPECILITSFSDAKCTDQMAEKLPPNVKRWYSNNVNTDNHRVIGVPIGLRTSNEGEIVLRDVMYGDRPLERNLVYMNFYRNISRNPNPREGLYEQFLCKSWVTAEGGFEHMSMPHFYGQIKAHPYVLSPPGAGPDCHRHWEAILLGSIPIVLKSKATQILNDLPCLQVDNWRQVTEKKLLKELPLLKERFNNKEALEICWFDFWHKKILET